MRAISHVEYLKFVEAYSKVGRVKNAKARSALYYFFYCVGTLVHMGENNILKLLEEGYKAGIKEIGNEEEAIDIFERYLEDNGLLVKET